MNVQQRNELIEAYFTALDEEELDIVEPHLAEDFAFAPPGMDPISGPDAMQRYYEEYREFSGTVHDLQNRLHDATGSAVEGRVVGQLKGDEVEADFCDVFEFTESDEQITGIRVYVQS